MSDRNDHMQNEPSPYRERPPALPVVIRVPVCAECRHVRVSPSAPYRSEIWRCYASASQVEPAKIDPITGTRTPERPVMHRCDEVNGEGQCVWFEPQPLRERMRRPIRITLVLVLIAAAVAALVGA